MIQITYEPMTLPWVPPLLVGMQTAKGHIGHLAKTSGNIQSTFWWRYRVLVNTTEVNIEFCAL